MAVVAFRSAFSRRGPNEFKQIHAIVSWTRRRDSSPAARSPSPAWAVADHVWCNSLHIGFQNYVLCDGDAGEESARSAHQREGLRTGRNTMHAKMMIYGLQPVPISAGSPAAGRIIRAMRESQIAVGCVDSYKGREELNRMQALPYALLDIGMDVTEQTCLSSAGRSYCHLRRSCAVHGFPYRREDCPGSGTLR